MKIKPETSIGGGAAEQQHQPRQPSQRLFYLDFLKFWAMLMVIAIHVGSIAIYRYHDFAAAGETWNWLASAAADALGQCCIGIFFIISGVLLLNPARPPETAGQFFRHRVIKILGVYLVWQFIYILWPVVNTWGQSGGQVWPDWGGFASQFGGVSFWLRLLLYPTYYHLWYLQALIGIYLITPLLRTWLRAATKKEIEYGLLIWLVGVVGTTFLSRWSGVELLHFNYLLEIGGFYVLGYYFNYTKSENITAKHQKFWAFCGYLLATSTIFFATWYFTAQQGGQYDPTWKHYNSLPNILAVVSLFWLVKWQNWPKEKERAGETEGKTRKEMSIKPKTREAKGTKLSTRISAAIKTKLTATISGVAGLSLGIYLVHVIILEIWRWPWLTAPSGASLNGTWPNLWLGIPLASAAIYFLSYWLVRLLRLVPGLRNLV